MELLLFDTIKGLPDDRQHRKFKLLRDEIQLLAERQLLCTYTDGLVNRIIRWFVSSKKHFILPIGKFVFISCV